MSHDPNKVVLGATSSSMKVIDNLKGTVLAGLRICQKSDGTITTAVADGAAVGISVGKDFSSIGYTSVCRVGLKVPIALTAAFTPVVGAQVFISDTTGKAGASGAGFTGVNAFYSKLDVGQTATTLTAINEDGTQTATAAAFIDMPGGL